MTLKTSTNVTKCCQLFYREIASLSHCRVETRSGVSLGQNETIAVRIRRLCRIDIHFFEIKKCEQICS